MVFSLCNRLPDDFLLQSKNFVELVSTLLHLLGRHFTLSALLELPEETDLVSN
jgi:hypothetical protein